MKLDFTPAEVKKLRSLPVKECIQYWDDVEDMYRKENKLPQAVRMLVKADLFYLLVRVCKRTDILPCVNRKGYIDNQFAFERCREVEAEPDGYVDLWAREHWKTSIKTFGKSIQDILTDPEITIGLLSHTRPIAKAFLRQIMREFEENVTLKTAFPDVLWDDVRQAPKWSEDDGIIVKRKTNPNEATVEAWGLVDGQPVSKHYKILLYDDIVVQASVSTPEMIDKTRQRLEESYNLGVTGGGRRMSGTRWHFADAYRTVIERGTFIRREYPGRKGGTEDGESILWSEETHHAKRREQGPFTYAAQILLNPAADAAQGFRRDWIRHYSQIQSEKFNNYILVDAASSKKKSSDYTAMMVVGLGSDGNYYVLDMVRDRLNLAERLERLFDLHRKYKPKQVRYERYGMASDIDAIKARQEQENYRFDVTEVAGVTSKVDRVRRLIPIFEQGKMYLPRSLHKTNWEGIPVDLVQAFIEEEYIAFPSGLHDDQLDALSRISDPDLRIVWPKEQRIEYVPPRAPAMPSTAWMA
jgi:predicted phage terminase large subunit-like protein